MEVVQIDSISTALSLTLIEKEIFTYLLQHGESKTVEVRVNLHLQRTPFYRALTSLQTNQLVTVNGGRRSQLVRISDIDLIKEQLNSKKKTIEIAASSIGAIAKQLKSSVDSRYFSRNIEVISGEDAYLKSMKSVLAGGGKILRDLCPISAKLYDMAGDKEKYVDIVKQIKALRLKKEIAIRILVDGDPADTDIYSKSSIKDLKEVRSFSGNMNLGCYLNTCGSRTLFYSQDVEGCWGLVIKDEIITKLLNTMFDAIWANCKY